MGVDAKQQLGILRSIADGEWGLGDVGHQGRLRAYDPHVTHKCYFTYLLSYTYGFSPAPPGFASLILSPSSYNQVGIN
jgi:hypothetical protein